MALRIWSNTVLIFTTETQRSQSEIVFCLSGDADRQKYSAPKRQMSFLCALCASVVKGTPPFVKGDLGGFEGLKKNQQNDKETKVSYEKSIDNRYNRSGWSLSC